MWRLCVKDKQTATENRKCRNTHACMVTCCKKKRHQSSVGTGQAPRETATESTTVHTGKTHQILFSFNPHPKISSRFIVNLNANSKTTKPSAQSHIFIVSSREIFASRAARPTEPNTGLRSRPDWNQELDADGPSHPTPQAQKYL